jgi:hypothetical protein
MMEGQSDRPSTQTIKFFNETVRGHNKVEAVIPLSDQVFRIDRSDDRGQIIAYVTDLYTIGFAEFVEIKGRHTGINCVVTMSAWNEYTSGAKRYAIENRMGLFTFSEFMGALNWSLFWKYTKKER